MSSQQSPRDQFQLLLVEDDQLVVQSLKMILPVNWQLTHVVSLPSDLNVLPFHAAFVDMHLSGKIGGPHDSKKIAEGPAVIALLAAKAPHLQIIGISGDLSVELMESCLRNGATRFFPKPILKEELVPTLEKIEAWWQLHTAETRNGIKKLKWIGKSLSSEKLKRQIADLRGEPGPILIEGETGTGKEVVFNLLNQNEPNRHAVYVNVAGIPENLFDSEMYGHVKGAFTGADRLKIGLTEAAHGGDLLLDEIEALPLPQQVKLLRFLESGEIRRVGAQESIQINTRVIVTSNQPLDELIKKGLFREDLRYRLSGKVIHLPPLRDRPDEIEELAKYFLSLHKPRNNKYFASGAIEILKKYSWPGNVRELKRICDQVALTAPLPMVRGEDIQAVLTLARVEKNEVVDLTKGLEKLVEDFEARIIKQAMSEHSDAEKAAEILKISRSSIYKKMKDLGLS